MTQTYSALNTGDALSITIAGKTTTIASDAINYEELLALVRRGAPLNEIEPVLTPAEKFKSIGAKSGFEIRLNESSGAVGVFFNGQELSSKVSDMILKMFKEGSDFDPLRNFLIKALGNSDAKEADVLYDFITINSLPITPDGDFLAFKATCADGLDCHSRTVKYEIGSYLHVENYDRNKNAQCGTGLHVGGRDYVKSYGNHGDAYFIVKVNPMDCIFYRPNVGQGKMRVRKLFVYAQCFGGAALDSFVPFMVASSPEGDILEEAAKRGRKVKQKGGQTSQVSTQKGPPSKKVSIAKKDQTFVTKIKGSHKFTTKDGKEFTAKEVQDGIKKHGQRGYAAITGVARTTLQGWVETINGKARTR